MPTSMNVAPIMLMAAYRNAPSIWAGRRSSVTSPSAVTSISSNQT
jgi:hypothetical protein